MFSFLSPSFLPLSVIEENRTSFRIFSPDELALQLGIDASSLLGSFSAGLDHSNSVPYLFIPNL